MSGDSSNPGGSPTPDAEQIKTFRDFLANYNKLSEICFSDCVWDFTNRKVSKKEDNCAMNCAEKYLKMNQRISTRFQVTVHPSFILAANKFTCLYCKLQAFSLKYKTRK